MSTRALPMPAREAALASALTVLREHSDACDDAPAGRACPRLSGWRRPTSDAVADGTNACIAGDKP